MSHNNGVVINLEDEHVSKSKTPPKMKMKVVRVV
jgi:translation initiation factor IF-1